MDELLTGSSAMVVCRVICRQAKVLSGLNDNTATVDTERVPALMAERNVDPLASLFYDLTASQGT